MAENAKAAEKKRLAEALRANLRRRKAAAQTRAGRNIDTSAAPEQADDDAGKH